LTLLFSGIAFMLCVYPLQSDIFLGFFLSSSCYTGAS
jgi:hypothetical protein